jgi:hypothetical protein
LGAFFIFFAIVVIAIISNQKKTGGAGVLGGNWGAIETSGVPARGILLQVDAYSTRTQRSGVAFESRMATIDVEIPGTPPYEVRTQVLHPANMRNDVLPGASVELRVDRRNKKQIVIVGPGSGFAVASMAPPGVVTPAASPPALSK